MSTLLLRLEGPMQSWGTQSRFVDRDTGLEPSKSGVIGLLCAALGRPRTADLSDLVALKMGVRVDRPGILQRDYQTVGAGYPVYNAQGQLLDREGTATISPRYYLADASFLVGLEGEENVLRRLDAAVRRPIWPLYLGRKAFFASRPIVAADGTSVQPRELEDALRRAPFPALASPRYRSADRVRWVVDAGEAHATESRRDVPLSFAERRFAIRRVRTTWEATP